MSRKFTNAQHAYIVAEHEHLAILEALLKWEDKLVGRRVNIVTDHGLLTHLKTQPQLSNRQVQWVEFMSRFDYHIHYVEGKSNKVADALSRYHEIDKWEEVTLPPKDYVNTDVRLDPQYDDLPQVQVGELQQPADEFNALRESRRSPRPRRKRLTGGTEAQGTSEGEAPDTHADHVDDEDPTVFQLHEQGVNLLDNMDNKDSFEVALKQI